MKKFGLAIVASLMLLITPSAAFAANRGDDDGMRNNQIVNRFNDMADNKGTVNRGTNMSNNGRYYTNNGNRVGNNGINGDWDRNMTTRNINGNTVRANAADDGTDWGWLGLLGLIGLAGMMGRGRDRGDIK